MLLTPVLLTIPRNLVYSDALERRGKKRDVAEARLIVAQMLVYVLCRESFSELIIDPARLLLLFPPCLAHTCCIYMCRNIKSHWEGKGRGRRGERRMDSMYIYIYTEVYKRGVGNVIAP